MISATVVEASSIEPGFDERTGSVPAGNTGLPIPVEIVALQLVSTAPVEIPGSPGGLPSSFFDVFVALDPTSPSPGMLEIQTHDDPRGDTFDSFFDVLFEVMLVEVNNPTNVLGGRLTDHITTESAPFSHAPTTHYPTIPNLPAGNFYPGVGGRDEPVPITLAGAIFTQTLTPAAVPEPGSLILLAVGLSATQLLRRRQRFGGRRAAPKAVQAT